MRLLMPEPKRTWKHTLCERCWFAREPERFPVQIEREPGDLTVDQCCACDTMKLTRIYTRIDPDDATLLCGGKHLADG